jgi:SMI1-KNR4 cell-wall
MLNQIFDTFVAKWVGDDERFPLANAQIEDFELQLSTTLPASYRAFLSLVGPVSVTYALLESIVEQRLDIVDVQDFLRPDVALEQTRVWREMGLPENLFAIANDSAGNLFCLAIPELGEPVDDDPSVWFFEHEEEFAADMEWRFTEWIRSYADLQNTAQPL